MNQHTPGPWKVGGQITPFDREIIGPNGEDIGLVNLSNGADEPTIYPLEANARLIAAAPDLLLALQTVMGDAVHGQGMKWSDRCKMAHDAIAKVTGTPQTPHQTGDKP